jgi:predicted DNA-binding protein (UPF0251 family)
MGGPGRPMKPRFVRILPGPTQFSPITPEGLPAPMGEPIYMTYDEFEAFRLIYHEGLDQEEAASKMGVSRGTVWRCLESARSKIASMLVERRQLIIAPAPPQPRGEITPESSETK